MSDSSVQGEVAAEANDGPQRAQLHQMWSAVAGAWGEHADYVEHREAPATARILELAGLRPGEQVLELACGPGGLGLQAARAVAPGGEAVLSDVAAGMTAIAAERARAAGAANVRTLELDLEQIAQPAGAYDAVLCRAGLMFAVDPARSAREIARVLRPGGRAVVAVWGPRERNPWVGIVLDAVGEQLGAPVPPPGVPGPFSLADREELAAVLREGGFAPVDIEEFALPMRTGSFDEWWHRTTALAGPLALILAGLPEEAAAAIKQRAQAAADAYASPGGLEMPGEALIARAVVDRAG